MTKDKPQKQPWLKLYSIVLIANAIYILVFYLIMQIF